MLARVTGFWKVLLLVLILAVGVVYLSLWGCSSTAQKAAKTALAQYTPQVEVVEVEKPVTVEKKVIETVEIEKPVLVEVTSEPTATITPTPTSTPNATATVVAEIASAVVDAIEAESKTVATPMATSTVAEVETPSARVELPFVGVAHAAEEELEVEEAPSAVVAVGCEQARDLGPWAPDGRGETFEVTATVADSAGIVLGLWWPHGGTPWGNAEITSFVPPGLSIEVQAGGGRGFDYPLGCSQKEIWGQMNAHIDARVEDTHYYGFIEVDELIRLGLVEVRFDNRGELEEVYVPEVFRELDSPEVDKCPEGTQTDHSPVVNQTWAPGPSNSWRIVNFWTNQPDVDQTERKLLLEPNQSPVLYGGGSAWSWPSLSACLEVVQEEFARNSLPEVTLDELYDEGLVGE